MAHLGTYTIGGITYDRHTGRAVAGTDTVDTEFSEEFKNYYNTVNLENYNKIADIIDISGGLETAGLKDISKIEIFLNKVKQIKNET